MVHGGAAAPEAIWQMPDVTDEDGLWTPIIGRQTQSDGVAAANITAPSLSGWIFGDQQLSNGHPNGLVTVTTKLIRGEMDGNLALPDGYVCPKQMAHF